MCDSLVSALTRRRQTSTYRSAMEPERVNGCLQGLCSLRQCYQGSNGGAGPKCEDVTRGLEPLLNAVPQGCNGMSADEHLHSMQQSCTARLRLHPSVEGYAAQGRPHKLPRDERRSGQYDLHLPGVGTSGSSYVNRDVACGRACAVRRLTLPGICWVKAEVCCEDWSTCPDICLILL